MNPSAPVSVFRQAWFWVVLAAVALGCAALSYRLFPQIFPVVSLDIRMDRSHAIAAARALAAAGKWGPAGGVREVARFGSDPAQAFIELEGGGKPAFAALLADDLYSPYTWQVRLFKESETNQTMVRFKPGGEPYGFDETLRQKTPGAALTAERAREIAEAAARAAPWRLPLDRFKAVETAQVKRPGGRVDHTFTYERTDRQLGEGRLRLQLVVSGDRLTALSQFVKVPEAFTRRYEAMRSANNAIAAGGGIALLLFYILGGGIGGFLFLLRQRALLWRQALVAAAVIAGLQIAAGINAWPLAWFGYDTAVSAGGFVTERLVSLVAGNLVLGFIFFLSFLAAEGLSRRAFPRHPQLWRLWSDEAAPTPAILGRTVGGYLLAAVMLLYVVVFYYFAIGRLGWWTPSEALVDPDSLSHYWPWLTPLANAAQAGTWEESLFRAVPLAGAALLGSRFGGRKWWIAAAFVLQAAVFASGHANYPGQPAYSRVVELILPSFLFGAIYLRFGLLPGIVMHFSYDATLMALPLFAASASGIWLDRSLVVLLALLPLWVVLWRRWRAGRWSVLPEALRNGGWQPPPPPAEAGITAAPFAAPAAISGRIINTVLGAGLAGLVAWIATVAWHGPGTPLQPGRTEAVRLAQAELARRGVKLPATYHAYATVNGRADEAERFVWQTAGQAVFATLLGGAIPDVLWRVRFYSLEGDVAERAEEWHVFLDGTGAVNGFTHELPEARAGETLSEADARQRVQAVIREKWNLDPAKLVEVSAVSAKHPKRLDWTFVYRDPAVKTLGAGQARLEVRLAGSETAWAYRLVFVPEDWERSDRALQSVFRTGGIIKGVAAAVIFITGIALALVAWSRKKMAGRVALSLFGLIFASMLLATWNRWPATVAGFSNAQPLELQQLMSVVGPLVGGLFAAGGVALLAGLAVRWVRPSPLAENRAALAGAGAGLAVAGGLALVGLMHAGVGPAWPSYGAAGCYLPWFAPVLGAIPQFLSRTAVLLFVFGALDRATGGWQRQRAAAAVLAFVACAVLMLPGNGLTVAWWLLSALGAAGVMVAVYLLILRHDLTLLPLAVAVGSATGVLADGLTRAYPGALPAALLAAVSLLVLGGWSMHGLRRFARERAVAAPPSFA